MEQSQKTEEKQKLSEKEKLMIATEYQHTYQDRLMWAEQRSASVADEFIRLEVQIATIIFAFSSLFLTQFTSETLDTMSQLGTTIMKLGFVFSIFCLLVSLSCGLLHLKTQESFWDKLLKQRLIRYNKWCSVSKAETTYEEALAYQDGTGLDNGVVVEAPSWTWILQTICLGLGVIILFILGIVFLFS